MKCIVGFCSEKAQKSGIMCKAHFKACKNSMENKRRNALIDPHARMTAHDDFIRRIEAEHLNSGNQT